MSRQPTNSDLASSLNGLAGRMGALEKGLEIFTAEFLRERDGAQDHRRALRETIGALGEAVRSLTKEVGEIKPFANEYREDRGERRGVKKLGRLVWLFVAGIAGGAVSILVEVIKSYRGH